MLRADISSAGIATGAEILRVLAAEYPEVAVHQVEMGVDRGLELIRRDRLDVVLGLAPPALDGVEAELIRREPVLLGMVDSHPWATRTDIPVRDLAGVPLLLPSTEAAGEWRRFVAEFCRAAGFGPTPWKHMTHGSVAAADALRSRGCVTPTTAWTEPPTDLVFVPLMDPVPVFAWSAMWRAGAGREPRIRAFRDSSRIAAQRGGWRSSV